MRCDRPLRHSSEPWNGRGRKRSDSPWARLQVAAGGKVWLYRFTQAPPFPAGSVRAGWGASHFAELWYMFDHLSQEPWTWTPADHRLADTMSSYWVNFVATGDPNGPDLPHWPSNRSEGSPVMALDTPHKAGPEEWRERHMFLKAATEESGKAGRK